MKPGYLRSLLALALALGVVSPSAGAPAPEAGSEASAEQTVTRIGALLGQVSAQAQPAATPLAKAKVYAYQLSDLSLEKVVTDDSGKFLFSELPAGLYRIITFKPGFVPSVVMLTRSAADAQQYLDIELAAQTQNDGSGTDFWTLREQIPSDVLRDIEVTEQLARNEPTPGSLQLRNATQTVGLSADVQAVTGTHDLAGLSSSTQVSGGRVGVQGKINDVDILVDGDFLSLSSAGDTLPDGLGRGRTQRVSVEVQTEADSSVRVSSANNRLRTTRGGAARDIGFEAYEVAWSQNYGELGRSDFRAHYTEESNFYNSALLVPAVVPDASRSIHLEGSYTTPLNDRSTVQAGVRYRERETYGLPLGAVEGLLGTEPIERLDVFGRGGVQVKPAFLVEYGLYSTLRDGQVSFVPKGGFVVDLGEKWRASTGFSHRIETEEVEDIRPDFFPVFFRESSDCELGEAYCYRASVSREWGQGESFVIGAVHREVAETQRLSFDEDFFNHEESLYLLPGDRLPELQVAWTGRVSPSVVTRVESTVAQGGGGVVYTDSQPFENEFQYMVTSVDAHFERSDTGVFLIFHQLQQALNPVAEQFTFDPGSQVEMEKLELMLTQDIDLLSSLASQLALQLNMEVSRSLGDVELFDGEELRKRIMGGLAVKF